jgi:type III pantothenate kinase
MANGEPGESQSLVWRGSDPLEIIEKAWSSMENPERVVISNVAGPVMEALLLRWLQVQFSVLPEFISVKSESHGVRNGYADPGQLGVDRWLALIALWHRHRSAGCIVDCGTAITLDVLAADGTHLGGLIMPGLELMTRALGENTYALPVTGRSSRILLANNTQDGINAGSLYSASGGINKVVRLVGERLGPNPRYLITGGDAKKILPELTEKFELVPDLVIQGLGILADEN